MPVKDTSGSNPAGPEPTHEDLSRPGSPAISIERGGTKRGGKAASAYLARYGLLLVAAALFILFTLLEPGLFATWGNVKAMLSAQSVPLILALAVVIPLRAGDFDLSVASVMVFCSAAAPLLWGPAGLPLPLAIAATILFGALVGLVNSFFVVWLNLNAFVITLGAMTLIQGLTTWITGGNLVSKVPQGLVNFSRTELFGLPLAVYYGLLLAVALWYVLEMTPLGRYLLFVGGNRESARLAGIPVAKVRIITFLCSAVLSSFAGLVLLGKLGVADPTLGPSYLLPPYAAAFLGIAAVQLGRFNAGGTVIAVYLLIIATTGLLLLSGESWVTDVFNGAALILAITFASLAGKRQEQRA